MAWWMAIPAVVSAGQAIYGAGKAGGLWGQPPKRRRSALEKQYITELQRISKEGLYSPGMQKQMVSGVTRTAEEIGARRKAGITQRLVAGGLEHSIVPTQATRGIGRETTMLAADLAERLAQQNIMSRAGAMEQLGGIGMQRTGESYEDALRRRQAREEGWQTVLGAGSAYLGMKGQQLGLEKAGLDIEQYRGFIDFLGQHGGGAGGGVGSPVGGTGNFDAMSFNEAFRQARSQGLPTFMWRGSSYNTRLAG